jgi:hypothetical protein
MDEQTNISEPVPFRPRSSRARKNKVRLSTTTPSFSALHTACQSLQDRITNLEQDWNVRDEVFWQQSLQTLQAIRQTLTPLLDQIDLSLIDSAYLVDEHIDEAAILITAHASAHRPRREAHLRQRHRILSQLQNIARELQEILPA